MDAIILDVVDSMSNTPLPGATISVNNVPVGMTDANGVYSLENANDTDEIEVSYVNYPAYKISAGIIEGSAQIQLSRTSDVLPTVSVSPSPKKSSIFPWLIAGGLGVAVLGGRHKKIGSSKGNTALLVGAGALGLGAIYIMTRPKTTTPTNRLTTQQLIQQQAVNKQNPIASALNTLSSSSGLFSSLSKFFSGGGSPSPQPSITDPGYSSPYDTSFDPSGYNFDTMPSVDMPVDFTPAPVDMMAGLPGPDRWGHGRAWGKKLGASYGFKSNGFDRARFGSYMFNINDGDGDTGDEGMIPEHLKRRMTKKIGASYGFNNAYSRSIKPREPLSINFSANDGDGDTGDEGLYEQKKKIGNNYDPDYEPSGIGASINPNDPTFNAAQIIGQTLIAKTKVTAYDEPFDGSNIVNTYQPGQSVGVVVSWLDPDPANGRSVLYWQFMDTAGTYYYIPHYVGEFNVQSLIDSGALTTGMQTQAAQDANKGILQTEIEKYAPIIIAGGLGVAILSTVLKNKK